MLTRRDFLKQALTGLVIAGWNPTISWAENSVPGPILIAVHLTGGNDALNTLVPFRDQAYLRARPNLALKSKTLLTVEPELAFHPSLNGLTRRYEAGQVLLFPGIGRPDHDRSHFRSSDLWHCAGDPQRSGWMAELGKQLKTRPVSLGNTVSGAVACPSEPSIGILGSQLPSFPGSPQLRSAWAQMMETWPETHQENERLRKCANLVTEMTGSLAKKVDNVSLKFGFAPDEFGRRFETTTRLIAAGFPSRVYHIGVGQFDTHANQPDHHARELSALDRALSSLLKNLQTRGLPVVVMVYSEFGRRVAENFTGGTDHGAGGLAWLVGSSISGGIHGPSYDLDNLADGDLPTTVDYRELYRVGVAASFEKEVKTSALFG